MFFFFFFEICVFQTCSPGGFNEQPALTVAGSSQKHTDLTALHFPQEGNLDSVVLLVVVLGTNLVTLLRAVVLKF